ncbi:MAG: site-specific integrase [Flavobacteriales bacterium]|nr:site-specific integrase [Flavobacteriales bacterium]
MASVKVLLLNHRQRTDGTCPLSVRIIKDRKPRYIFTGHYILPKDWDESKSCVKKSHDNSVRLNNLLHKKVSEASGAIMESEVADDDATAGELKKRVTRSGKRMSFYDLAKERIIEKEKSEKFSVSKAEESIVNNIRRFAGNSLVFEDITTSWINRFKAFCISELGHKGRTVTNQLIFIRTMYNRAIQEGIVQAKHYPFAGDMEKIRIKGGLKIGLTQEEIQRIEALELERGTPIWHTRNVWLFAFYFAGIRVSDVLKMTWADIKDGRVWYVMNKNDKPISLKIPEKVQVILDYYIPERQGQSDYIFPDLKKAKKNDVEDIFRKTRTATKRFNKYLKVIAQQAEVEKNLSNHIARHSFGNIAGERIHPLMLQKLYRHSDLKTTINYQSNFIHKEADEALDEVINF